MKKEEQIEEILILESDKDKLGWIELAEKINEIIKIINEKRK